MSRIWSSIGATFESAEIEPALKETALALVCGQMLYAVNQHQRRQYELVLAHRTQMAEVLDHLGLRLGIDDAQRVVYVVPEIESNQHLISKAESLLSLVLRRVYGERINQGLVDQDGIVAITIEDLFDRYRDLVGVDLEFGSGKKGRLRLLIESMHRFGYVRMPEPGGWDERTQIQIMPGIALQITGDLVTRLAERIAPHAPAESVSD